MYKTRFVKYSLGVAGAALATAGLLNLYNTPVANGAVPQDNVADRAIATLQDLSDTYVRVAEDTSRAVVYIEISKTMPSPTSFRRGMGEGGSPFRFFDPRNFGAPAPQGPGGGMPAPMGSGSGFIVSEDGYIVTNHHVAGDADALTVTLQGWPDVRGGAGGLGPADGGGAAED